MAIMAISLSQYERCFLMTLFGMCVILAVLFFPKALWAAELPALKVLSTPSCPACSQMGRILDELDSKYGDKVKTEKINLMEHRDIAKEYNVRYVPHLLFVDGAGKVVKEEVGYIPLDKVLATFKDAGINIE
jgi:thioredoxin 1